MAMNKRKTTTAIAAGVTAAALLLGGTFAWTSISQQAKNEAIVDINPGGRLHDDFNGTNKDVYVENFGDTTTGVDIFARIRLDQYFEVGQEAGKNKTAAMADRNVKPLIGGDINDVETWITYKPGESLTAPVQANDNWQWTLGNGEDNKPYYMPTFNKNKDSLAADINGTYEGTVEGDIVHYDDYKEYGADSVEEGTEVYDWDDEDADEEENPDITTDDTDPRDSADVYHKVDQTHTAQQINYAATVYTMAEWIAAGSPVGPYWVYDTDGWAYWAQPIAPGETTGLLLDGINMSKVPDDNYYYGINVVGQFATKGDISEFNAGEPGSDQTWTPEAEILFGKITNTEEIVISGADTILPGTTATYSATRMALGNALDNQPDFVWTATAADGTAIDGVTMTDGTLTVGADVAFGTQITVTATVTDGTATLAEGDEATTNTVAGSKIVTVAGTATVTSDNSLTMYTFGGTTTETFTAAMDDAMIAGTFTWSVTDGNGNKPTDVTITADATDSTKATLTVGANETADKLIVTATFKPTDSEAVYIGSYEVKNSEIETTDDMSASPYVLFTDDGSGNDTYAMTFVRSYDSITSNANTYGGTLIQEVYSVNEQNSGSSVRSWITAGKKATYASFENKMAPASTSFWFNQMPLLKVIDFNGNLDGANLVNMEKMFYVCSALESIDLSWLKLSDSVNISARSMFSSCSALKEAKLPENIKVSTISSLFDGCSSLTNITGLNTWDVSAVESFAFTFMDCHSLAELDISSWKTTSATSMYMMFQEMSSLTSLDLSNFDLTNVTDMTQMFVNCENLTEIIGAENWNVSKDADATWALGNCPKLYLDCSAWTISSAHKNTFKSGSPNVTEPTWVEITTE